LCNRKWTFDAGSPDGQARWIALIKSAIAGTKADGDEGDAKEEVRVALLALQLLQTLRILLWA